MISICIYVYTFKEINSRLGEPVGILNGKSPYEKYNAPKSFQLLGALQKRCFLFLYFTSSHT